MINEQRLRIDELSREIAQLKDDLMDKEQIIAGLTTSAPADSNSAVPSGTTAAKTEDYWRKYFDVDKKHGDIDQFLSFSDDSPKSPEPWCGSLAGTPPKTAKPGAPRGGGQPTNEAALASDAKILRPKQVVAPAFPTINSQTTFLAALGKNLIAASVYDDRREMEWLLEVHDETFEELSDTGESRFAALDSLMATSLEPILPRELGRKYREKCEEALNRKDVVTGRQIVWLKSEGG